MTDDEFDQMARRTIERNQEALDMIATFDPPVAKPTMLSDLMRQLHEVEAKYGDIPVFAKGWDFTTARLGVNVIPRYYDGGCIMPLTAYRPSEGGWKWVRSKTQPWPWLCCIDTLEPEILLPDETGLRDTIDGVPIPDAEDDD